jgi:hypothetical protein
VLAVDLLEVRAVALPVLRHWDYLRGASTPRVLMSLIGITPLYLTSTPIERAVPSMIFDA